MTSGNITMWIPEAAGAEISLVSAATVDIGSETSPRIFITGGGTISSFGAQPNRLRFIQFEDATTLVNSAALGLQFFMSYTTVAGELGMALSDDDGNWIYRTISAPDVGVPYTLPSKINFWGDSFSQYPNNPHTSSGDSFASIQGRTLGYASGNVNISAASGNTSFDQDNQIFNHVVVADELNNVHLGTNNARLMGDDADTPNKAMVSFLNFVAQGLHLSVPDADPLKIRANAGNPYVFLAGTWTAFSAHYTGADFGALYSVNTSGTDTIEFILPACDKFCLTLIQVNGSTQTFEVRDNDKLLGTYDPAPFGNVVSNISQPYGAQSLMFSRGDFVPRKVQIILTGPTGQPFGISMAIGGAVTPRVSPLLQNSTLTQYTTAGYAAAPTGTQGNTQTLIRILSTYVPGILQWFNSRIKTARWDTPVWDPDTMTDPTDGLHPDQLGATTLATLIDIPTTASAMVQFSIDRPDAMVMTVMAGANGYPLQVNKALLFNDFQWVCADFNGSLDVNGDLSVTGGFATINRVGVNGAGNAAYIVGTTDGHTVNDTAGIVTGMEDTAGTPISVGLMDYILTAVGVGTVQAYQRFWIIIAGTITQMMQLKSDGLHLLRGGLAVAEGSNCKQGIAALTAGSVIVANTSVTANSRILLTSNTDGGSPGFVRVSARTPGTSFTITSSNGADTSTIAYEIFEPG